MLGQPHRLEAQPFCLVDDVDEERRVQPTECDPELQGAQLPSGNRCHPPDAHVPPSTCTVVPVMKRAPRPARKTAAAATSSTWPGRRTGDVVTESPSSGPTPGVGIRSGAMQLTRMSLVPSSNASDRLRLVTAAFCAA